MVGRVVSSTTIANRLRLTVEAGQPVTAEITDPGAQARPGPSTRTSASPEKSNYTGFTGGF